MKKNQLFYFLIALVIAVGIWAYVVTTVSPESEATYYNIPVVLKNADILKDKGLMVVTETEPTVTLKLRGNRSDLSGLKNSDIVLIADLAKINEAGEQSLFYSIDFGGTNAFEVLTQTPSAITLEIARWSTKEVDVVPVYTGVLPSDYIDYREDIVLSRDKITITGPKNVVDQITQARLEVDLNGKTETVSESSRFTLCDKYNQPVDAGDISVNAAEVSYTLKILRTKTLQLTYDVKYAGGATAENTTITLDYGTIEVAGSEWILDDLGDTLHLGSIDLAVDTVQKVFTITEGMLKGAENRSQLWQVKATITLPKLQDQVIQVPRDNVIVNNIPEGLTVEVIPAAITVTLRGYAEYLENITQSNVSIKVDGSQLTVGANRLLGEVVLIGVDGENVSVIGACYIDLNAENSERDSGGTP